MTLIEVLIVMLVGTIAMLALYGLVDASNKLTKQETEVADVQQSARIGVSELSRVIRQSRVGALYFGNAVLPIANNSPGGTSMPDLSGNAHFIRKGTDVIEVRGVISGDKYILDTGDVTCAPDCTAPFKVTIPATAATGYVNFPAAPSGTLPSLALKTKPFYFVVVDGSNQSVTAGSSSYLVPLYTVGVVNTTGSWYTYTPQDNTKTPPTPPTFTFTMDPKWSAGGTNADPRKLNASTLSATLSKPSVGGAVDVVRFFVDEGASDATGSTADTHPSLVEATLDAASGNYDMQPLVEEAEDFQIAYGVDGIDGSTKDGGVSPEKIDGTGVNKDEWVGNVANEVEPLVSSMNSSTDPKHVDAFIDTTIPSGPSSPAPATPLLRSVWISLVVKSTDPDLVYNGPGARGIRILDSTAVSFSTATGRPYRRRPLSLAVSLRNYS